MQMWNYFMMWQRGKPIERTKTKWSNKRQVEEIAKTQIWAEGVLRYVGIVWQCN